MQDRVERDHAGGKLGRRIRVDDAAPNRPARPRLQMPDDGRRLGKHGRGSSDAPVALERRAAARARPAEDPSVVPHAPETRNAVQIHHDGRPYQAHVHHRHQALPTSEHLGVPHTAPGDPAPPRQSAAQSTRTQPPSRQPPPSRAAAPMPTNRRGKSLNRRRAESRRPWIIEVTTRRWEGAGGLPAGPCLLRADEGASSDLVARCEWWTGLRVSVSRGRPRPSRRFAGTRSAPL